MAVADVHVLEARKMLSGTSSELAPIVISPVNFSVAENTTSVGAIVAVDPNLQLVTYSIAAGGDGALFTIDGSTGALSFISPPDFESPIDLGGNNVYDLTVDVTAGGVTTSAGVGVTVLDVNEPPTAVSFENTVTTLPENASTASSTKLADIVVTDDAQGTNTLSLSGVDADSFEIVGTELHLKAGVALNFETKSSYNVTVNADDTTVGETPDASEDFTLTISDVNEAPVVTPKNFMIGENSVNGAFIGTIVASDVDAGQSRTFAITAGNVNNAFAINPTTGVLSVNNSAALNFEAITQFNLTITATDNGAPPLSGSAPVTVFLRDVNDAPVVAAKQFLIGENSANNAFIGTIPSTDQDSGQSRTYTIVSGNRNNAFAINPTTGVLSVNNSAALNFEAVQRFDLTIKVTDNGSPAKTGTAVTTVFLRDVNEAPVVNPKQFLINENSANGAFIGPVKATDPDAGQSVTYAIVAGNRNNAFAINPTTGVLTVNNSAALNFESTPQFDLTVKATDNGNPAKAGTATITVFLRNVNEAPVVNPKQFLINENSVNGAFIGTVTAQDPEPGQSRTFAITAGNVGNAFAINTTTGVLTVNNSAALDFETTPQFNLTVTATDNGNPAKTGSATVTVFLRDVSGAREAAIRDDDTTTVIVPSPKTSAGNPLTRLFRKAR